ncbi:hypothetical protein Tco_1422893, partial [Tanacetum coccineum]
MSRQNWRGRIKIQFRVVDRVTWECSRYSISDGLQDCVNFVGHLAMFLFEIGFKLGQSRVLRCHEVSPRLFCSGLKMYHLPPASSEQDELPSSIGLDFRARRDDGRMYSRHFECLGFFGVSVTKLTIARLVNGSSCGGIDMVIKDLDLEPKIDAMMRDFLDPSWWKELSKEMS